MTVEATNGKKYNIRYINQNFEIETDDEITGLRKVFVLEDLSIGKFTDKRKELVVSIYNITPKNQRLFVESKSIQDNTDEYEAFMALILTPELVNILVAGILKYVEKTTIAGIDALNNNTSEEE